MTERYERRYGYRHGNVAQYASAAEIAKAIRADIKTARAEGLLPNDWKYSVRSSNFSGGCSIDVTVSGPFDEIMVHEDFSKCAINGGCHEATRYHAYRNCGGSAHLTELAESAEMTLKRIHNAYNYDGSEVETDYFDVRYYGQVTFDYALWAKARA